MPTGPDLDLRISLVEVEPLPPISPEQQREFDLGFRRRMAGTRSYRPEGAPPTRLPSGEWMQKTVFDLPEAMVIQLEELAEREGIPADELVRAALVAAGVGDASHVVGIQDGSSADDDWPCRVRSG